MENLRFYASSHTAQSDVPAVPAMPALQLLKENTATDASAVAIDQIARWAREYLCTPHPELGRSGPMCPFVPMALQKRMMFAAVYQQAELDVAQIKQILLREMQRFMTHEPVTGSEAQFKSLLVLFPALPPLIGEQFIELAQQELQSHFVPNGLMVGEFHALPPDKPGLWNAKFKPLYSPLPMLVIRHMVPTDFLFLQNNAALFHAWAALFGAVVPERFRARYEEAVRQFGQPESMATCPV